MGVGALGARSGSGKVAAGGNSLNSSNGSNNTAIGFDSEFSNNLPELLNVSSNTFIGYNTGQSTNTVNNASAIGEYAEVGESNPWCWAVATGKTAQPRTST